MGGRDGADPAGLAQPPARGDLRRRSRCRARGGADRDAEIAGASPALRGRTPGMNTADPLDAARRALEPGETLVWADRPDPQALARSRLPQVIRGVLGLAVIATFLWLRFLPNWPGGLPRVPLGVFLELGRGASRERVGTYG